MTRPVTCGKQVVRRQALTVLMLCAAVNNSAHLSASRPDPSLSHPSLTDLLMSICLVCVFGVLRCFR